MIVLSAWGHYSLDERRRGGGDNPEPPAPPVTT